MKAVEYFIYSMKEAEFDFLNQFDSIDNALDAIPQPSSSSTVRVYTPLKDMKSLPPDGKWAKEGAKHTAECVHILNDNLKTISLQVKTLNEMIETEDLPEEFTVQGYVLTNYHNYKTIVERLNTMESNVSNILQSVNAIVASKLFTDEERALLRSVDGEPPVKKARVEDGDETAT